MRHHLASAVACTALAFALSLLLALSGCTTRAHPDSGELPVTDVKSFSPTFSSLDELADASDVIMIASITSVRLFGVLDAEEDPNPSEWALLSLKPERVFKGGVSGELVVAWEMFITDGMGKRIFELTHDGVPNPEANDRYLLFLTFEDAARQRVFGGATTHAIVMPVGIMAVVDGKVRSAYEGGSPSGSALNGRSESELASLLAP